ncbi:MULTISPECIES: pilus assembly protein PilB [Marinobacter]|uniref:Pilus assembly protein PilB n=1 Tax=Marinobacter xiaoshiensis TaxID=3073652 RepID=A0ABU2HG27_9GAMM|nr:MULTISPECIES: pilus assembly protein PilB [unclassified Marinobacter]MBK1874817.1 pilus assembly protein PilB [Marinobacter sp. 1-3A]MBK1887731.1 pilus assembly protein PilB [Marinobacter sp. DY40_1A1]MDS1309992.1 pilus assembly protein PilB [Marinobacter sp. F60267]
MRFHKGFEEKSRLGRLLVNRGYLSESQVEEGLRLQRESGIRLGEVFITAGWITEKELGRVLKHQSRYRSAAAMVTMATLPFQPLVTFAASNNANAAQVAEAGQLFDAAGMSPLTEDELSAVAGQGNSSLFDRVDIVSSMAGGSGSDEGAGQVEPDVIEGMKLTANVFFPVLNVLDSDLTITGVHYREGEPRYTVAENGRVSMAFPERIEEIRMDNIRVRGGGSPSMGNVSIQDISFHPDSRMTIYTR